jgi:predicted RNA-binding Zn ribbon-like protein
VVEAAAVEFVFVGNRLAVDFVNTELFEASARIDLLSSDAALMAWARASGLAEFASAARGAELRLDRRVRPLRAALRSIFEARIEGRRPAADALGLLNDLLTSPRRAAPLRFVQDVFVREPARLETPGEVLRQVAEDAAELLSSDPLGLLRRCANHHCILLFYDASKSGRRRWCSMSVCGNRAKVAAHHERQKPGDTRRTRS